MSRIFDALRRSDSIVEDGLGLRTEGLSTDPADLARTTHLKTAGQPQNRILRAGVGNHVVREKFRFLDHRLRSLRATRPLTTLLITSAVPREGKTVVTINLAATLALGGDRVLLVDGDMRKPGIGPVLGLEQKPGLAECLQGERRLHDSLICLDDLGVHYLPAGTPATTPADLLENARLRELIQTAASEFKWVVVDSPPLVPFTDAHWLAGVSDAALLVVRSGLSRAEEFDRGITALEGTYVAGVVLNGYDEPHHNAYYSYYQSNGRSKRRRGRV